MAIAWFKSACRCMKTHNKNRFLLTSTKWVYQLRVLAEEKHNTNTHTHKQILRVARALERRYKRRRRRRALRWFCTYKFNEGLVLVRPNIDLGVHHLAKRLTKLDKLLLATLPWQVPHVKNLRRLLCVAELGLSSHGSHLSCAPRKTTKNFQNREKKKSKIKNLKRRPKNLEKNAFRLQRRWPQKRECSEKREREETKKKELATEQREYTVVTALPLNRQHCERNPRRRRVLSLSLYLSCTAQNSSTRRRSRCFSHPWCSHPNGRICSMLIA